jgi:diguanylate cyclase (GGDEF)-like protein
MDKISSFLFLQAWIMLGAAICLFVVNARYPAAISRAMSLYGFANVMVAIGSLVLVYVEPVMRPLGQIGDLGPSAVGTCLYYFAFRSLQERRLHLPMVAALFAVTLAAIFYFILARQDASMSLVSICLFDIALNGLVVRDLFRNFRGHGRGHQFMGVCLALYVAMLVGWVVVMFMVPHQIALIDRMSETASWGIGALSFSAAMGPVAFLLMCNDEFNTQLQTMVATDPLTGIANRRRLMERGEEEILRIQRFNQPLSVIMIDLDHFKKINDEYGHAVGDQVLKAAAQACVAALRDIDLVARSGGEEFAVLLPQTPLARGLEVAERLRLAMAAVAVPVAAGGKITVTASLGVAEFTPTDASIDQVMARADRALYRAKAEGRNRISGAAPSLAQALPDGNPA